MWHWLTSQTPYVFGAVAMWVIAVAAVWCAVATTIDVLRTHSIRNDLDAHTDWTDQQLKVIHSRFERLEGRTPTPGQRNATAPQPTAPGPIAIPVLAAPDGAARRTKAAIDGLKSVAGIRRKYAGDVPTADLRRIQSPPRGSTPQHGKHRHLKGRA